MFSQKCHYETVNTRYNALSDRNALLLLQPPTTVPTLLLPLSSVAHAISVLAQQTYQGGTQGSRLCGEDRDQVTENSKVHTRAWDTRFIQVRAVKMVNPTSFLEIKYGTLRLVLGCSKARLGTSPLLVQGAGF
jgi:hypothetical protein